MRFRHHYRIVEIKVLSPEKATGQNKRAGMSSFEAGAGSYVPSSPDRLRPHSPTLASLTPHLLSAPLISDHILFIAF
jgi:hypothetical protein